MPLLDYIFPEFSACFFDFPGCGLSEGKYVTLGERECHEVHSIITALKRLFGFEEFFLWGKSMGAVSAILYSSLF